MNAIMRVLGILLVFIFCASGVNLKYSGKIEIKKITEEQGDCSIYPCWNNGVCRTDGKEIFCDCKPPYAGKFCEKKDCSRNPCKNGGECRTQGDDISCDCKPDFYGKHCEQRCFCHNGYCEENWRGLYVCKCPPEYGIYTESVCQKCNCGEEANCTWKVTIERDIKYCFCKAGYSISGGICRADCERLPCKNGGKCISIGNGRSYCDCIAPFFGGYCENHPNSCFSNPCQNNGKCENFKSNYICSCENGYTGHDCETAPDPCNPNPCKNDGKCKNDDGKHKCLCIYGYTGNECETVPDPCNSNPCKNNGICENHDGEYVCSCKNGYTGHECEEAPDPCNSNPCKNNGKCESHGGEYVCSCENGYTLPECEAVDYCVSNPCQNGGTCRNGKYTFECTCTEMYRGSNCSESNWCEKYGQDLCGKEKCEYNETTETGYCVCEKNKIFHEQSKTCIVDHCLSHPCQNGGVCKNGILTFDCTCTGNYGGKDCSENTWCLKYGKRLCNKDKCEYDETTGTGYCVCENGKYFHKTLQRCIDGGCSQSIYQCLNGGMCNDKGEGHTCYCKFAFTGERCERDYRYMIALVLLVLLAVTCFAVGFCVFRRKQKLLLRDSTLCKTLPNKAILRQSE